MPWLATPAVGRTVRVALPWAHREAYASYFERLAAAADAGAGARRLITHIDSALDGPERVALWHALWRVARRLRRPDFDAVAACLDGRHAPLLAALHQPWDSVALVETLAAGTRGEAAQAAFVGALLDHHGLDPLADPGAHPPTLVLLAARAAVHGSGARLAPPRILQLQVAALVAAEADPSLLPQGMALLFELALHAADEASASAVLAELMQHGLGRLLRPERVRAWLDGSAFDDDVDGALPLQLAAPLQAGWLQVARWTDPATRQALLDALQRPGPRRRLQALADALGGGAAGAAPAAPLAPDALQALRALDTAYALIEGGGDAAPAMRPLLERDTLAVPSIAAILRASARWHGARGDAEGQALALLQARRHAATPALRAELAALLPAPAPTLGDDWCDEEPYWSGLLQADPSAWRRLAAFQLATLWTEGELEPQPPRRCRQRLGPAQALWLQLSSHARYAAHAFTALRQPAQTLLRPALREHAGTEYLWFDTPGATGLTIVFACLASHHSYPEVAALRGRLPGQHLMFVRCPDKNWYSDRAFDELRELLRTVVATRFARRDVSCWYGSMGGHGALKFALEFGWRAIVFNPQTDLDLWAAFRPRERALLWGAERHARLADWPQSAWQRAPLYYACGAATADREALSVVLERLRECRHASAIIEKFDDAAHAGLMNRIAAGPVAATLACITQRLRQLEQDAPLPGAQALDDDAAAAFWQRLDAARTLKVELQMRDGRLWWQPSLACATRG